MTNALREHFGKVAVLMGGLSAERDVSLQSGAAVLAALKDQGIDAHGIDAQRDVFEQLAKGRYQRAFLMLHGRGGEDGAIQGALEFMEIPYTGSGSAASAVCMNKVLTKQLWLSAGLPTPSFVVMDDAAQSAEVVEKLGLPLIVKPALEGSSIGMSKVEVSGELPDAWELAAGYGAPVMAERWIQGNEYTVTLLGKQALPVIRLQTPHNFYDYSAKYIANDTLYHIPCGLSEQQETAVQELSKKAFFMTGASGWGRVDLMMDADANPWLIEANTVPGMTDHSLVPMAAKAAGIDFQQLVVRILETSFRDEAAG